MTPEQLHALYAALEVRVRALEQHYAATLAGLGVAQAHEVHAALRLQGITLEKLGMRALMDELSADAEAE